MPQQAYQMGEAAHIVGARRYTISHSLGPIGDFPFMAVMLEFIDLIVPIATIRRKYPGGWDACLDDHEGVLGGRVWHDEHLFRDGTMNPMDMQDLVAQWAERGFEVSEVRDGQPYWKDLCVVESMFGGPTRKCDWLVVNRGQRTAHLSGTEPGTIAGPSR